MAYGQDKVFAAVRNNGSGPFIDLSSVSGSRERVMEVVRHHEETIPGWCKANPLIRVEPFRFVTEAEARMASVAPRLLSVLEDATDSAHASADMAPGGAMVPGWVRDAIAAIAAARGE